MHYKLKDNDDDDVNNCLIIVHEIHFICLLH